MESQTTKLPYNLPTALMLGFVCLFMAGVLASGCDSGGSEGSEEEASVVGTYTLIRLNGQSVPGVISRTPDVCGGAGTTLVGEANGGSLRLEENGTFRQRIEVSAHCEPSGEETGRQEIESAGTYTVTGSTIRFSSEGGASTGTIDGDVLTVEQMIDIAGESTLSTAAYEK